MPQMRAEFEFTTPGWGEVEFEADDKDQMEFLVRNYIRDNLEDASDIEITKIELI